MIQLVRNCREKVSLVVCQPPLDNVSCNLHSFLLQNIQNTEITRFTSPANAGNLVRRASSETISLEGSESPDYRLGNHSRPG